MAGAQLEQSAAILPPYNQLRRQHIVTPLMTTAELTSLMAKKAKVSWGKANQFPIAGVRAMCSTDILAVEQSELLDPTVDDPSPFLRWSMSGHYSVVLPVDPPGSKRALETINVFALRRAPP